MSRVANDPQEWANKRKAALERAKQLREERKNGIVNDDATFTPTVNKRPSYLNNRPDTLDKIAHTHNNNDRADDIFEQPLPGAKKYDINKIPSPSSDALGREMKKFTFDDQNNNSGYKSKFMQQYDHEESSDMYRPSDQAGKMYNNNKQDYDSDERFMSMLRSDGPRKSSKPGWNDDTQTGGIFDAPKPVKAKGPVSTNRAKNIAEPHPDAPRRRPLQSKLENQKDQRYDDYSDNYTVPPTSYREQPSKQTQENSYSKSPRQDPVVNQARSRLSLLKSKMRSSESSGSSRNDMHSSSSASLSVNEEYQKKRENRANPSTAPLPVDDKGGRKGGFDREHGRGGSNLAFDSNDRRTNLGFDSNDNYNYNKPQSNISKSNNKGNVRSKPVEDYDDDAYYPSYNVSEDVNEYRKQSFAPNDLPPDAIADIGELIECPDCGRKFNSGPYQKHVKICKKVFLKKRKVFDSQKHRIADNPELVKILKTKTNQSKEAPKKPPSGAHAMNSFNNEIPMKRLANNQNVPVEDNNSKSSKWKQQSNAFREAMKAARQVSKAIATGAPLPPPTMSAPDPSLIPCPHCGRRFNEKAGERHIPQCKNIKAQPTRLSKGGGISAAAGSKLVANGYKSHARGTF